LRFLSYRGTPAERPDVENDARVVNGGPGTDTATVDPKLDKLISVERHNKK